MTTDLQRCLACNDADPIQEIWPFCSIACLHTAPSQSKNPLLLRILEHFAERCTGAGGPGGCTPTRHADERLSWYLAGFLDALTGDDSAALKSEIAETRVLVDSHAGPARLFDPEECSLALIRRYDLSERHAEALRFVLQGFCIKDVCAATGKSERYAKYGRERMYMKLHVRDGLPGLLVLLARSAGTQVTESDQPATSDSESPKGKLCR